MRHPRLADRLAFAERFTAVVIERPFYSGLRRVAAMYQPLRESEPTESELAPRRTPAPNLSHAA